MDEHLNDEEIIELEAQVKNGIFLSGMLNTLGWQDVLHPMLTSRREAALAGLLKVEGDLEKFISAQQCFNSFNFVLLYVEGMVESGKQASERLEAHKNAKK